MFDLRQARLEKGLTQKEAAEAIGVGTTVLLRAEKGTRPRPGNALKIADWYETTLREIWGVQGDAR